MSKLTSMIRRAPKRFSALALMVAAAIIVPTAVLAWGPSRTTFTMANPANYVTFNSITDNPVHGDERNFMQVREASASNETYSDDISLQANKEYVMYVYYHNNASTTLNDAAHGYAGIAKGAYVKAEVPGVVTKGSNGTKAVGYVGAANANPAQVWDDVNFKNATTGDLSLNYVPGSTTIHNFGKTNGQTLSDSIVTTGATIGYDALNGEVPGCNEFSGFVTFRFKTTQSSFSIDKQVRVAGQTEYKDSVTSKPGDTLEYRIEYKNTGTIQQNNVVVKDTLPKNVTYVAGSTTLKNAANPAGKAVSDNLTNGTGINIGNYTAGSNAYVKFSAKVAAEKDLVCGTNTLVNKASAQVGNETKDDTATTVVPKECLPVVKYTCDSLSISRISKTEFTFTTAYTVENATFKNVTYIIRDAKGAEVERKTSTAKTLNYTQTVVGKYTVEAVITVSVNGQDKTISSANCKKEFEVPATPDYCPIPGKEYLPKDSKDCVNVETPPELPQTGAAENIVAVIGLGALIASIAYYAASRRALNQ
jgi:uncharacterized repeat protein (TIGR01451 family)/LPXTG-motif cell wall-anchored protein